MPGRSGANVIGPVVVYVDAGDPRSAPVRSGDTLRARPQVDLQKATTRLSAAAAELPALMQDARTVMARVHDRRGTVGAVLSGQAMGEVDILRTSISGARARFAHAAPRLPVQRAKGALARVDSIRALLRSGRSSLGRYRRDSTLTREIAAVRDELAALHELLGRPDGSVQRWSMDSALARSVADAQREMANLFADVRRRPLRYFPF